jgi:hypothetical protein
MHEELRNDLSQVNMSEAYPYSLYSGIRKPAGSGYSDLFSMSAIFIADLYGTPGPN